MIVSRRTVLASGLAAPLVPLMSNAAFAAGHGATVKPNARSFILGDFHVTTLLDGGGPADNPQGIFGMNVSAEEFARVSAENFISADNFQGFFTPVLVQNGSETILFDTGLGRGGIVDALATAGVEPGDVTHVVLTHMHPDHIGGLMSDGAATFPNAAYITGSAEYNFWSGNTENRVGQMVAGNVTPLAEKMTFLDEGGSVVSGITAMDTSGHTPGHMGYMLDSGGQQLMIAADLANHYVWSLAYPDWEVRFDMDKEAAAATRRRVLGMLAADKIPMMGYHMPFPAAGFVETRGDGFHWTPVSYQLD